MVMVKMVKFLAMNLFRLVPIATELGVQPVGWGRGSRLPFKPRRELRCGRAPPRSTMPVGFTSLPLIPAAKVAIHVGERAGNIVMRLPPQCAARSPFCYLAMSLPTTAYLGAVGLGTLRD